LTLNGRALIQLSALLFIAFSVGMLANSAQVRAQASAGTAIVDFNGFGIASVKQTIYATDVEIITIIGKLLYVSSVVPSNVTYYAENNTIVLVPPNGFSGQVEIDYIAQVANPSGSVWISNFTSPTNCTVILPLGAVPLEVDPLPLNFTVTSDSRLAFYFTAGNISIAYTLSQSTSSNTTAASSQTKSPSGASGFPTSSEIFYGIIVLVAVLVIILAILLRKRFFRS